MLCITLWNFALPTALAADAAQLVVVNDVGDEVLFKIRAQNPVVRNSNWVQRRIPNNDETTIPLVSPDPFIIEVVWDDRRFTPEPMPLRKAIQRSTGKIHLSSLAAAAPDGPVAPPKIILNWEPENPGGLEKRDLQLLQQEVDPQRAPGRFFRRR